MRTFLSIHAVHANYKRYFSRFNHRTYTMRNFITCKSIVTADTIKSTLDRRMLVLAARLFARPRFVINQTVSGVVHRLQRVVKAELFTDPKDMRINGPCPLDKRF